jgi:hypothetical protein
VTCALCNRRISKADVAAHRYVRSRFTGAHYCLNEKRHEELAAKRRKAAA